MIINTNQHISIKKFAYKVGSYTQKVLYHAKCGNIKAFQFDGKWYVDKKTSWPPEQRKLGRPVKNEN